MPKEDKRLKILKALEEMIASKRFYEITLDEVSKEAQVGKGTIYRYFKNKNDLFFQLATSWLKGLREEIEDIANNEKGKNVEGLFTEAAEKINAFIEKNKAATRVLGEHEGRLHLMPHRNKEDFKKHRDSMRDAMMKIIKHGIKSGEIRKDIPAEELAHLFLGAIHSCRRFANDIDISAATIVNVFLNGAGKEKNKNKLIHGRKNAPK